MQKQIIFIEKKAEVFSEELIVLRSMYQPIIGIKAVALYASLLDLSFFANGIVDSQYDTDLLLRNLGYSTTELLNARKALEAVGLLRTFIRGDDKAMILKINKPLRPIEFLKNSFLKSQLEKRVTEIDIERIVFGLQSSKTLSKDGFREETVKYQDMFDFETKENMTTLEIEVPKSMNIEQAMESLTVAQFYNHITNKRMSESKNALASTLINMGFSSASINAIFNYAHEKNGKVVNKYVGTIADDLKKKGIQGFAEVKIELADAKQATKVAASHVSDVEEVTVEAKDWDDIYRELGDVL